MARILNDNLYRVSVGNERNHIYVEAKDVGDLICFLAHEFPDTHDIYGAKEIGKDGMLQTVPIITNPLFQSLCVNKEEHNPTKGEGRGRKPGLDEMIQYALTERDNHGKIENNQRTFVYPDTKSLASVGSSR